MSGVWAIIDGAMSWIATNARSFSYFLPDTLELALYLTLAAYLSIQLAQQQM